MPQESKTLQKSARPEPQRTINADGVILPSQTNDQGYFLATNQRGTILLENP